jgi:hypothetical protein
MTTLRDFVAQTLESQGAAVEAVEPDGLEVLAPAAIQSAMGWPEMARLRFGTDRQDGAIRIGLEGDWLDRFDALLGAQGRWAQRQLTLSGVQAPADPERVIELALDLPNAVWRFQRMTESWTRCLLLTFRYTALSDEKREGLVWLGFNLGTGAVLGELIPRLRPLLDEQENWQPPDVETRQAGDGRGTTGLLDSRIRPLLRDETRRELEPFLRAMRRRLDRDRTRIHAYHEDLRGASLKRLAGLAGAAGEKAEAGRRREALRVAAIEREYRAKVDDLRNNYALRVMQDWVQALQLFLPVQRLDVLIRRRKQERLIRLDWHPSVRLAEPPLCDWGLGLDRSRLVCDEKLHLTDVAGQAPCPVCSKAWCRACDPQACRHCGQAIERGAGAP